MEDKLLIFEHTFTKSQERACIYLPFEVPEGVESFTASYDFPKKATDGRGGSNVDFALIDPFGRQAGASGASKKQFYISQAYSTFGYRVENIAGGTWHIVAGLDKVAEEGVTVKYSFAFKFKQRRWLKGDTHLHTLHSDGRFTPEDLIEKAKRKGLDWIIITDHNNGRAGDCRRNERGLSVINGMEVSSFYGHANFWGAKGIDGKPAFINSFDDFLKLVNDAADKGATVSLCHPDCKRCGWHMPYEGFPLHCLEVWNGPMRTDNLTAVTNWHKLLLSGRRLGAVGGSDFHRDYVITDFFGKPCTVTLAESNTEEDILKSLREGRGVITHNPGKTMLYLTSGGFNIGDTVKWEKGARCGIVADKLKRGHRLRVYNNDEIIYDYTSKITRRHEAEFEVKQRGFVRAEVVYKYGVIPRAVYRLALRFMMPEDLALPVPPMLYALTNPIFFE